MTCLGSMSCSNDEQSAGQGKIPSAIKIGLIACQTGALAPYGKSLIAGAQLAIDEINAQQGINGRPLRIILEDSKSAPADAVAAFTKLATSDHVPVVIGFIGSSLAMASAPIANREHVVLLSPGVSTPAYSTPDDFTFRNRASAADEVNVMARIAKERGYKRVALLYVNNEYGVSWRDIFVDTFRQLGDKVVRQEAFQQGATDLRTQLTKVKSAQPDAIYMIAQAIEYGYALRQAKELQIDAQFLATIGIESQQVLDLAGEAAEGVLYTMTSYDSNDPSPRVQGFEKKFKEKTGQKSDAFAANAYDAVYIVAEVMKKGNYTADSIRRGLYQMKDFPGVAGSTTFDRNGDVTRAVVLKRIHDGQYVLVSTIEQETGKTDH